MYVTCRYHANFTKIAKRADKEMVQKEKATAESTLTCTMLSKVIQFSVIILVSFQNEVAGRVYSLNEPAPKLEADYQTIEIPKALKKGSTLEIRGQTVYPGKSFHIDFMDRPDGNIRFHMRFDYGDGPRYRRIVFNSLENGRWKNEESYDQVLAYNPQLIQITLLNRHFQIVLDGYDEYIFKYRMPIEGIKFLGYGGYYRFNSVIWK